MLPQLYIQPLRTHTYARMYVRGLYVDEDITVRRVYVDACMYGSQLSGRRKKIQKIVHRCEDGRRHKKKDKEAEKE